MSLITMVRVAEHIERNRAHILQAYAEQTAQTPSARGLSPNELIDTLPEYLTTLSEASRRGRRDEVLATQQRLEETHISHRLRVGYNQEEVTSEYLMLGRILAGLWDGLPAEQAPSPSDLALLNETLERALERVHTLYSGYTVEDRQAEKRVLRRLEALAGPVLEAESGELHTQLRPLVEVLQEALGAQAAALLLADESREHLLPTTSTGRWASLGEREPVPVEARSFLGRVALMEEPLPLPDAARPLLEVSEGVRRSGMRSLLGLRLWPQGKLLGVLSVGFAQVRPFEPRVRRYFETLIEYLSGIIQKALLLREMRRASERVRQSEARYRLATQAISDVIWEWDLATDALEWSEGVRALVGSAPEELGRDIQGWYDNIHPEERERVVGGIHAAIASGAPRWTEEYRFRHRDGGYVYVSDHGVVERDAAGRAVRMVGAMRDITERRRSEEALHAAQRRQERSEAMLRTVVETLPVGVWVCDETGRLILGNAASRDIWGGQRLVGMEDYAEYQGWWLDTGRRLAPEEWGLSRALRRGEHSHGELIRIRAFDGSQKVIRLSAAPLRDAEGRIFGAIALNEDVTQLQAMEQALRSSEREHRTLTESMAQVVWTARPGGEIDYVNRVLARYVGRSVEEMLGTRWHELILPEDLGRTLERWEQSLATGEAYEVEHRLRGANGAARWFLTRAVPMRGPDGGVLKWFGTSTDIDELKQAEEELRRRAAFEQQLVGIVSHDLRNPLNAIMLSTVTLLRRHAMDERQRAVLSRVQASAERATRMIRDLLDFTQARLGGGLPIQRRPLDLHELTRQVVDEVRLAHPERALEVEGLADACGEWDPDRVAQVITNLVGNALRYSPEDTPVRVTTRGEPDAVALEVHNRGAPIPVDFLPRLFEPLERATAQPDRASRSIGLGLFIVKSIVLAHGGSVDVHSTAAEGTTFRVRLPRHPALSPEARPTVH